WMQQDAHLVPRLQHGALPAVAREDVGAPAFQAPFHFLAGRVRHQHLDPRMWIGPLEFLDAAFQPDFLAAVEHAEAVVSTARCGQQCQGHQEQQDRAFHDYLQWENVYGVSGSATWAVLSRLDSAAMTATSSAAVKSMPASSSTGIR